MQITPVDQDHNLFEISNLIPQPLVDKVLQTPWIDLTYSLEDGNRELRRRIHNDQLPWINEWHDCIRKQWDSIVQQTGCDHLTYSNTGFWIDEATYTCPIHTDGELPGAIQMYWVGESKDTGTTWYQHKDHNAIRHQFEFNPNTGYIMINKPEPNGYRKLQWHGMLNPVSDNSFRVSSYSWLSKK